MISSASTFVRTVLFGLAAISIVSVSPALAHEYKVGDLMIDHPWARATPPMAKVAGGYLSITNHGDEADTLIGGSADIASRVELHEMAVTDGVMKMRPLTDGIIIAPGKTVVLKPGGLHVMLMGLTGALTEGEKTPITLTFEKAGSIEVELAVEAMGAGSGGMEMDHSHHGHDHKGH